MLKSMVARLKRAAEACLVIGYAALEKIVPSSQSVCFISFPDVDDNALALFSVVLRDNRYAEQQLTWLVADVNSSSERLATRFGSECLSHCRVVKKNSLIGLLGFLRARRVYFTHGHYRFVRAAKGGSKLINLWHGMPLKAIGCLDGKMRSDLQASHRVIASSEFFRPIMARAFDLPLKDVGVTGLPRCDSLLLPTDAAMAYCDQVLNGAAKLVLWMPTYRISSVGEIRNDSGHTSEACIDEFIRGMEALSAIAAQYECRILVKLHPMDFLNQVELPCFDSVIVLKADSKVLRTLGTYELLAVADGLITDVSSVCFDYIVTRRPILINTKLASRYTRGMVFDPNLLLDAVFTLADWSESDTFFDAIVKGRSMESERLLTFCRYADANSSRRVLDFSSL